MRIRTLINNKEQIDIDFLNELKNYLNSINILHKDNLFITEIQRLNIIFPDDSNDPYYSLVIITNNTFKYRNSINIFRYKTLRLSIDSISLLMRKYKIIKIRDGYKK